MSERLRPGKVKSVDRTKNLRSRPKRPIRTEEHYPPERPLRKGIKKRPGRSLKSEQNAQLRLERERLRVEAMRNKAGGTSFSATVVTTLFFSFILVYLAWNAVDFFRVPIATEVVRMDVMEEVNSIPGLIIRNEYVVTADRDGRVVFRVQDFARVRDGTTIAYIMDPDAFEDATQNLTTFGMEAITLNDRRHQTGTSMQVNQINNGLRHTMDNNITNFGQGNMAALHSLKGRLNDDITNRNQMIVNDLRQVRPSLAREHDQLLGIQNESASELLSSFTGIMSPFLDGFENEYTPQNMRALLREQVHRDMISVVPSINFDVSTGDPVFKIVDNTWYVVVYMPNAQVEGWAEGQNRVIYLENARTGRFEAINMRIHFMQYSHLETMVIFRTSRNVDNFLNQRHVNILTTSNERTGFMVPTSAITTRTFFRIPLAYVHELDSPDPFVRQLRDTIPLRISVISSDMSDTHVYLAGEGIELMVGDMIESAVPDMPPKQITDEDVTLVRGVYRATMNVAQFRRIELSHEMPDTDTHVLLDPSKPLNSWIRQFDIIVTNASMVNNGDIIR